MFLDSLPLWKVEFLDHQNGLKVEFLDPYHCVQAEFLNSYHDIQVEFLHHHNGVQVKFIIPYHCIQVEFLHHQNGLQVKFLDPYHCVQVEFLNSYHGIQVEFFDPYHCVHVEFLEHQNGLQAEFLDPYHGVQVEFLDPSDSGAAHAVGHHAHLIAQEHLRESDILDAGAPLSSPLRPSIICFLDHHAVRLAAWFHSCISLFFLYFFVIRNSIHVTCRVPIAVMISKKPTYNHGVYICIQVVNLLNHYCLNGNHLYWRMRMSSCTALHPLPVQPTMREGVSE